MSTSPCAPGLAQTFTLIIDGLCRAVAGRGPAKPSAGPLLILIWGRLRRLAIRFAALAARAQAGNLPPPRRRTRNPSPPSQRQRTLPEGLAWLIRLVPGTAQYGGQVQHLLSQPEMTALIEAAPQAGRLLRPLCRMLAIPLPPALRLPPKPAPATPSTLLLPEAGGGSGPKPEPQPTSGGGRGREYVWRSWRGIRMPEPLRPPEPA